MISPAPTPKAVNPRIRSLSASTRAFRKPRVSESVRARRLASIGTLNSDVGFPSPFLQLNVCIFPSGRAKAPPNQLTPQTENKIGSLQANRIDFRPPALPPIV